MLNKLFKIIADTAGGILIVVSGTRCEFSVTFAAVFRSKVLISSSSPTTSRSCKSLVAFKGDTVTSTWLGDQEVDIRLILDKNFRALKTLNTTKIYTLDGRHVPLSRLATVENIEAPRLIKHYDGEREVTVTAQISDDSVSPVELSNQLLTQLDGQYARNISINVGGS
ncbi:efflux RND transporter permease subunit [Vibrio sp. 404]|uniref:Efflux RND transporter permease subunit n=1 Tax=Vibrio marinisediminis TaxID=2758441 RepID=A0A7W2FNH7_9VIBR|nr:efflux RND transporter permease subunit [Vibrio marinisediminis]